MLLLVARYRDRVFGQCIEAAKARLEAQRSALMVLFMKKYFQKTSNSDGNVPLKKSPNTGNESTIETDLDAGRCEERRERCYDNKQQRRAATCDG